MTDRICKKALRGIFIMLVLFAAAQSEAQSLTVLHTFASSGDGSTPNTGLTLSGGRLYGGTSAGGTNGGNSHSGTIFAMDTSGGNYTILFSFNGTNGQGVSCAPVIVNGLLYGTTLNGGDGFPNADGVLFRMNTNGGNFAVLHTFHNLQDGRYPDALQLESAGVLCGTIQQTDVYFYGGSIFECALPGETFSYVATFTDTTNASTGYANDDYTNGSIPSGSLAFFNGAVYGTTQAVGPDTTYGGGTVYRKDTTGLTVMHGFDTGTQQLSAQGYFPYGGVVLAGNKLYGTTRYGGPSGTGVIFSFDLNTDQYAVLRAFTNAPDGAYPIGPLVASGNALYGTTSGGGSKSDGTVFTINLDGSGYMVLYNFGTLPDPVFGNDDGITPQGSLLLSGNALFGTCSAGGASHAGTVWKLSLPATVSAPQLAIARSGAKIVLTWPTNFTGFTLQSTTNVVSPVWSDVSPGPVTVNGQNTVTNAISNTRAWYRLKQ